MPARKPIAIGTRFTRLVVTGVAPLVYTPDGTPRYRVVCQCDCGNQVTVREVELRNNGTRSCGCLKLELFRDRVTTHGHTAKRKVTGTYETWSGMVKRCTNEHCKRWPDYGGRGIKVCERWLIFTNFLADMGERPVGMTLERKDNNGDYWAENCKWATYAEQNRNSRKNRMVNFNGETLCLKDHCTKLRINYLMVLRRVMHGWPADLALTTPKRVKPNQYH